MRGFLTNDFWTRMSMTVGMAGCLSLGCAGGSISEEQQTLRTEAFRATSAALTLDDDGDSVPNALPDNCSSVANNDQSDLDGDGLGDVCDPDPNTINTEGKPSARGEDANKAFQMRIEAFQGKLNEVTDVFHATGVRVCRRINQGPFAIQATKLKAALVVDDQLYGVTRVDLSQAYQRLAFDLNEKAIDFLARVGGDAHRNEIGKFVKYFDDANDNNQIDAGETTYGQAHWNASRPELAGVLVWAHALGWPMNKSTTPGGSQTQNEITTPPPPSTPPCDEQISSPLVLDLGHDGFAPFSAPEVLFDLNADGKKDLVGWPTGKDDALLAVDLNGDNLINSGAELFGNFTATSGGNRAANGFDALAQYDANHNGRIEARDPIFTKLRLWIDSNMDGLSQLDELGTLAEHGVTSISLSYMSAYEADANGNETRQRAVYTYLDAATGAEKMDLVIDVWFKMNAGPSK